MIEGLPDLEQTLTDNGFTARDLAVTFGPQTLGADREGHEWTYDEATAIERRYYSGGVFTMTLDGDPLVGGAMPRRTFSMPLSGKPFGQARPLNG